MSDGRFGKTAMCIEAKADEPSERTSSARQAPVRTRVSAMTMGRSARTSMRDPGLVAAQSTDAPTARVTFEYLAWATVWLLVGTTIGLIASIKLHWPEFLPFAWLSFGRVRPAHTNLVLFGWSSLVLVG